MTIDQEALARSLRTLAATAPQPDGLLQVLQHLTDAARDILRADGAALTLEHEGSAIGWVTVTDAIMQLLEQVQQDDGAGPSVSAYTDDQVVMAADLATDTRWESLAAVVGQVSIRSVLSIPFRLDGRPIGTLDLYATQSQSWSPEVVIAAEAFARVAADLVQASVERAALRQEVAQLQYALMARIWVEQAKGVLVERMGLTPEEAFEQLRAEARSSRRKVADIAREVIQDAQRERLAASATQDVLVRAAEAQARQAELALAALEAEQARTVAAWTERSALADERDRVADERDRVADNRDRAADKRDQAADKRDQTIEQAGERPSESEPP